MNILQYKYCDEVLFYYLSGVGQLEGHGECEDSARGATHFTASDLNSGRSLEYWDESCRANLQLPPGSCCHLHLSSTREVILLHYSPVHCSLSLLLNAPLSPNKTKDGHPRHRFQSLLRGKQGISCNTLPDRCSIDVCNSTSYHAVRPDNAWRQERVIRNYTVVI
jgi:hypothetical protein